MRYEVYNLAELKEAVAEMDDDDRLSINVGVRLDLTPSQTEVFKISFRVDSKVLTLHDDSRVKDAN